jgi:hypothetical protein
MQDGHIVLTGNMQANSPSLDLFVDGGNLYIPKRVASNNLTYFDTQGFPVTNGGTGVNAGLFVKGNIVIN